jgi:hypothetical protein
MARRETQAQAVLKAEQEKAIVQQYYQEINRRLREV